MTGHDETAGTTKEAPRSATDKTPGASLGASSMSRQVLQGANWSTIARLGTQLVQFAMGLVLARLLVPDDFGLVASIYVFSNFAVMFFDMGLGAALIHKSQPTERDSSTVFWVNTVGGLVFAGLLAAVAPLVAAFYHQPELRVLTPLLGLTFTLEFGVVHLALLQQALRFRAVAVIEIGAAILGGAVSVALAVGGAGVFALVIGQVISSLVQSLFSLCAVRWHPTSFISIASLRELWRFSGGYLGFNVVNYWGRNADNMLVGRYLGAGDLGYYNRGYNLMLLPITQVSGALGRVMFPALAAIKDDHERVRAAYLRTVVALNVVTVPLLLGIASTATGLVPLLWGRQWEPTVPLLQLLCIAGLPQCLSTSIGWLYQSQGQTGQMFRVGLCGSIFGVGLIVVGLHWGVEGVAVAVLARYWVMMPIGLHFAGRVVGLSARRIIRGSAPVMVSGMLMAVVVYAAPRLVGLSPDEAGVVGAQVVLGAVVYCGLVALLARPVVLDLVQVARGRRGHQAVPSG